MIFYHSQTKSEYLTRELGWHWIPFTESKGIDFKVGKINIVTIGQSLDELTVLDNLPRDSIWVLLYADETYEWEINQAVLDHFAVRGVIRNYPIYRASWMHVCGLLVRSLRNFLTLRRELFSLRFIKGLLSGFVMTHRIRRIWKYQEFLNKKNVGLQLGYTNLFSTSLEGNLLKRGVLLNEHDSLLELSHFLQKDFTKSIQFCFVGQRGSIWRSLSITSCSEKLEELGVIFILKLRPHFTGDSPIPNLISNLGNDYVALLEISRFSICPPGNYSIHTFRIVESVVMGALPVSSEPCPSDPACIFLTPRPSTCDIETWPKLIHKSLALSERERVKQLRHFITNLRNHFSDVNVQLLG